MTDTASDFTQKESIELLRKQKLRLEQQRQQLRFRWWFLVVGLLVGVFSVLTLVLATGDWETPGDLGLAAAIGGILGTGTAVIFPVFIRSLLRGAQRQLDRELLRVGAADLQDKLEEDFVTKLVQINFKYIDQYYQQTQDQANKSFVLASAAGIVGFGIVLTGIVMMFRGLATAAYVTTASGVLGEFIAAIFFYLYSRTIGKMADYHQKLVITQNISLALKIADGLDGEAKTASLKALVERLSDNVNLYLTQGERNAASAKP